MEEKTKNLVLGTIYSLLLFIIFATVIDKAASVWLKSFYPRGESISAYLYMPSLIPALFELLITVLPSILLTYAIIRLVGIEEITGFLKPNRFKVGVTAILLTTLIVIGSIIGFYYASGNPNSKVIDIIVDILMLGSNYLNGFMMWLFPIIMYYIIVCLVYRRYIETKANIANPVRFTHQ